MTTTTTTDNPAQCRGTVPGDGCNGEYLNKTNTGLCQKCHALDQASTEEEQSRIEAIPQCYDCGGFGKNIKDNKCAKCQRKATEENVQYRASQTKHAALVARPGAWTARTQQPNRTLPPPATNAVSRRLPRQITIYVEAISLRHGKPIAFLGNNSRAFPEHTMFGDAKEDIIQAFNVSWDRRSMVSLTTSDVIFRWHDNLMFHRNTDCGTVGEFYDAHFQLHNSETYLKMPVRCKNTPQPCVALTLTVDEETFEKNHGVEAPLTGNKPAKQLKRRLSDSADTADAPTAKRPAISRPLTSAFLPSAIAAPVRSFSHVNLDIVHLADDADNTVFPFPQPTNKLIGRLYDNKMSQGKDKVVFELEADGTIYVAKRCRSIPLNAAQLLGNHMHLRRTVMWLYTLSVALEVFRDQAEDLSIENDIHREFEVQPTFLAVENLEKQLPSVASGISTEFLETAREECTADTAGVFPSEYKPEIVWLIQRCNGKTQDKWNLMKPGAFSRSKIDATIMAFAHFVWHSTHDGPDSVFSHLQSASGRLGGGKYGTLIFDSLTQNDAVIDSPRRHGDEGIEGVTKVFAAHECNRICVMFGLPAVNGSLLEDEGGDTTE
ncbi:hypothetical protein B0H15DRAFT_995494 [Mycena belliarum]|uniref:Alpha-type protein kinase domain-containing protein n=1 Tax=Mycena belliarum TaxID=1033014 RepID=A0AAD6XSW3_9AGAR|nr:hypothetical protein B0H15DRAFT_995494 [Mycena belliae]